MHAPPFSKVLQAPLLLPLPPRAQVCVGKGLIFCLVLSCDRFMGLHPPAPSSASLLVPCLGAVPEFPYASTNEGGHSQEQRRHSGPEYLNTVYWLYYS